MNSFDKEQDERQIIERLYAQPVKDFFVKFKYHHIKTPENIQELQFKQIDSEPFFPRINRFYEFCNYKMNDYKFIDYEVTDCFTPGPRYYTDIKNEFNIH